MNFTQQQVRRRSSGLDEAAVRQALSQGLLKPQADQEDPRGESADWITVPKAPALKTSPLNEPPVSEFNPWMRLLQLAVFSMIVGAVVALMFRGSAAWRRSTRINELDSSVTEMHYEKMISACMANATMYCPHFPKGVLQSDYPNRYNHAGREPRPQCYWEEPGINEKCEEACDVLFRKITGETDGAVKVMLACKVGCKYARREHAMQNTNCHWDCKNTVWVSVNGKDKCNYDIGLGIATGEFERTFGTGLFGTGKACEMGCLLGNSRPCPMCDKLSASRQKPTPQSAKATTQ